MKVSKSKIQSCILETINETSIASQKAKAMGMTYVGFGRYSDGHLTYKAEGDDLVPMNKTKEKEASTKEDFLTKLIRLSNIDAKEYKSSMSLLNAMLKALPKKTDGENYASKEFLENILNKAIPSFNEFVLNALNKESYRKALKKGYFEKNFTINT